MVTGQYPYNSLHWFGYNGPTVYPFYVVEYIQLEGSVDSVPRDVTLPSLDRLSAVSASSTLDGETAGLLRVQELHKNNNPHSTMASSASPSTATFGNDSSEGSNGLMALPAVLDMVADSQDEPGSGGSALFSDISTPSRSWKQIAIRQESKQRDSPPRRSSSSPATPRASQKGVRSTSKVGDPNHPQVPSFALQSKRRTRWRWRSGNIRRRLMKCRRQWQIFTKKTMEAPSGSRNWRDDSTLPASNWDIL